MTIMKFQRGITTKLYKTRVTFLFSARHLIMLYISLKFHENILKGFQVIERTRNDHLQISKGNKVIERTRLRNGRTDIRVKNNMSAPSSVRGRHNYK